MNSRELETRRLALVARIGLQRVEMRQRLGGIRRHGAVPAALVALRVVKIAAQWWTVARLAWRLVATMRRK
jgi:hypothetical protein